MKEKKKAASTTANLQHRSGNKDSKSSRIIQQVRSIFLSGRKVTAKEINAETNSNDARRVISTLRIAINLPINRHLTFVWTIEENYTG